MKFGAGDDNELGGAEHILIAMVCPCSHFM